MLKETTPVFMYALALYFLSSLLRGADPALALTVQSAAYFILTVVTVKHYGKKTRPGFILAALLLGSSLITLVVRIFRFNDALISLPNALFTIVAILLGYLFAVSRKTIWKVAAVVILVGSIVYMDVWGMDRYVQKLFYGTWNGRLEYSMEQPVIVEDDGGHSIDISHLHGKYYVVGVWTTYSVANWDVPMPELQKLYDKYKGSRDVEVFAVHVRNEYSSEGMDAGSKIRDERGFTYPSYSIGRDPAMEGALGITAFPTILIINPDGDVIYKGRMKDAKRYLSKLGL